MSSLTSAGGFPLRLAVSQDSEAELWQIGSQIFKNVMFIAHVGKDIAILAK